MATGLIHNEIAESVCHTLREWDSDGSVLVPPFQCAGSGKVGDEGQESWLHGKGKGRCDGCTVYEDRHLQIG